MKRYMNYSSHYHPIVPVYVLPAGLPDVFMTESVKIVSSPEHHQQVVQHLKSYWTQAWTSHEGDKQTTVGDNYMG